VAVGKPEAAIGELDAALRLQFRPAAAFRRLELMEDTQGAGGVVKEWRALSETFPLLVTPYYQLGRIYWSQGDLDRAADAFGRIVTTHQETPIAIRFQRQALYMLERIDDARRVR